MNLVDCTVMIGQSTLLQFEPSIHTFRDVLFDPRGGGAFYDRTRRLISQTAYLRGVPTMHFVNSPAIVSPLDPDLVKEDETHGTYLFAGEMFVHYGHFIVSTLSRLWALREAMAPGIKLLFGNCHAVGDYFAEPFHRECFTALGLTPNEFARFDEPVRIRKLIVPEASFEENNVVYSAFRTLCRKIADTMLAGSTVEKVNRPVYLTRHRLTQGSSRIVNETALVEILADRGVEVIAPEQLDFLDQVRLWRRYPVFSGWISSAMHTSVFSPATKIVVLNYGPVIHSNQVMIDRVNENRCSYLYPSRGITHNPWDGAFGNNFVLSDPEEVATDILAAMERLLDWTSNAGDLPRIPWRPDQSFRDYNLIGPNLAAGKPATQSSVSQWSRDGDPEKDAAGATTGFLTGSFQFHTANEFQPWWQTDLLVESEISCVRLYNRDDDTQSRASLFEILVSASGRHWTRVFCRINGDPFGGRDGRPFVWFPEQPIVTRYVRIRLLDTNPLHLDQIEIIGRPANAKCELEQTPA